MTRSFHDITFSHSINGVLAGAMLHHLVGQSGAVVVVDVDVVVVVVVVVT
jgi:hypothetical protein